MTALSSFWQARSTRERRLLLIMAALAVPILLWLLLLRPLDNARTSAERRLAVATADIAALTAAKATLEAAPPANAGPVMPRVQAAVSAAGLSLASLDANGPNGTTARIAAARAPVLLRLIATLEANGISITSLSISRNQDTSINAQFTATAA
jgi:general secretion pathway protein M